MAVQNSDTFTLTLPSEREIVMSRWFEAPRQLVFKVWTTPEHVKRWYGCGEMTMPVCEIDLRPGGEWCYVLQGPDGSEFPFKGIYREVVPPSRLVHTQIFDVAPWSDHEALVTVVFEEQAGRTKMTETIVHQSVEARDAHVQSGVEHGARQTLDRLEEVLAAESLATLTVPAGV